MTEGNYSNVGHRGPVYKGLGAMNPCDNLQTHCVFGHTGFRTNIHISLKNINNLVFKITRILRFSFYQNDRQPKIAVD
jgi:hypothetical protein